MISAGAAALSGPPVAPQSAARRAPVAPDILAPARDPSALSPLSAYLRRISRDAFLTHREEIELGRKARAGDRLARRTLIERNLRLVVSVAVGYRRSGVPLEDLIQAGNIGLIEAVARFDPERDHRFSSFAVWRIRKAIQKAVAAQSRTIRVPRSRREKMEAMGRASGDLRAELGREPGAEELASRLGWTAAEVRATMGLSAEAGSLDQPSGPAEDAPALAEFVADESVPNVPDTVSAPDGAGQDKEGRGGAARAHPPRRRAPLRPRRARAVRARGARRRAGHLQARGQPATAQIRAAA